jgi:RNA polymerase sigma-70 factor, ECF subfamily
MKPARRADPHPCHPVRLELLEANAKLLTVARSLTRDREEAADLVQATCLRALERSSTLRNRSNVLGWLLRLMRNLHFDALRRPSRRWVPLDHEPEATSEPISPWRQVEDEEIDALADTLIPVHRSVWRLAHVERLDQGDIAARLGIPRATVATRVYRARAALRRQLLARMESRAEGGRAHAAG